MFLEGSDDKFTYKLACRMEFFWSSYLNISSRFYLWPLRGKSIWAASSIKKIKRERAREPARSPGMYNMVPGVTHPHFSLHRNSPFSLPHTLWKEATLRTLDPQACSSRTLWMLPSPWPFIRKDLVEAGGMCAWACWHGRMTAVWKEPGGRTEPMALRLGCLVKREGGWVLTVR